MNSRLAEQHDNGLAVDRSVDVLRRLSKGPVEFRVLGPVEVAHQDSVAQLGPMLRALLGALISADGRSLTVAVLADLLWGEDGGDHAVTVRSHVAHLRGAMDKIERGARELVITDSVGYALRVSPDQLDAGRFCALHREGVDALARGDAETAARCLLAALQIWRGPAYADLAEYAFARSAAAELEALRRATTRARIEAELALGRHCDLVDELERLVAEDPANEPLRRLFALAVYRSHGAERAAAICREGVRLLRGRGIESPPLSELHRLILRRAVELDWRQPEPVFDVPARSHTFTGRAELLAAMRSTLGQLTRDVTAVALCGLGGVGKTYAAVEYIYRHADEYDLVYWIPADQATGIMVRLAALAGRIGVPESKRLDEMVAALWERLRRRDSRWLLVYDDADAPQTLANLWPRGGNGHVIVTSRNRNWASRATPLPVEVLDRAESVQFVVSRLAVDVDPTDAEDLAAEFGDLPLALEQACAYMEQAQIPVAAYLTLYRRQTVEMLGQGKTMDSAHTVATTWTVSLKHVREQEPAAEQMLWLCAFLSPLGVPRELLTDNTALLPATLRQAVSNSVHYHRIVGLVGKYSLAEVTHERIGMHPLVQAVVRSTLDAGTARRWAGYAVRLVDAALPADPVEESSWWSLRHGPVVAGHARELAAEPDATVSVLTKAARLVAYIGELRQGVELLNGALAVSRRQHGDDGSQVAEVLVRLGYAYREVGELAEARDCFARACEIRQQSFGPDAAQVSEALTGLGLVLFDLDELATAQACLEESLGIRDRQRDPDELELAMNSSVLGMVLWRLNELPEAAAALERALHIREHRLGPAHHAVATGLDNLAKVVFDTGDLARARDMNERALRVRESTFGPHHFHVGVSLNHLGYVLRELGELDAALDAHLRALEIFERQLGPEHIHVAIALRAIGLVQLARQDARGARPRFVRALTIFQDTYGLDHTDTALCLADLGWAGYLLGDPADARSTLERAMTIVSSQRPPDHPDVARIRERLARMDETP
jgi:DNA-binding SARP family transcriptional activator/tetratricopeptide (TPR) repeat protein